MNKTIKELAASFLKDMRAFALTGFKPTPLKVLEERLEICHKCENFESKWYAGTGRCKECGCSIQAKLRMASSSCPINKWPAV